MLSKQDNETLCRVGPGTLMGNLMRQYWIPAARSDELPSPDHPWRVRASSRARRLAVRVLPGGVVEIVVPRGTRPHTVEQFVSRHRRWIERTLDLYRPADAEAGLGLPERIDFRATGQGWVLRRVQGEGPPRLRAGAETLTLTGASDRPALVRHALRRFLMRELVVPAQPIRAWSGCRVNCWMPF